MCDQPLQGTELQGREEKEQKKSKTKQDMVATSPECPGIVLKFFWPWKFPGIGTLSKLSSKLGLLLFPCPGKF